MKVERERCLSSCLGWCFCVSPCQNIYIEYCKGIVRSGLSSWQEQIKNGRIALSGFGQPTVARMSQAALRTAFVASMNEQSGQSDLDFQQGNKTAEAVAHDVPLEPRAGYRVTLRNSSASLYRFVRCTASFAERSPRGL